MTNHITLNDIIQRELKDEEFKVLFNKELMINEIAKMVFELRQKAGLTQKELADKAKTTQQVISRLEGGRDSRAPSLELLARIASAANGNIELHFKANK
jgi:DNA-binding XRE family transcriptional regulator